MIFKKTILRKLLIITILIIPSYFLFLGLYGFFRYYNYSSYIVGFSLSPSVKFFTAMIIGQVHIIEYMPIALFIVLFIFGLFIAKNRIIGFWELKGIEAKRQVYKICLIVSIMFGLLMSFYSGFIFPKIFVKNAAEIPVYFLQEFLEKPESSLKENNLVRMGDHFVHVEKIIKLVDKKGWEVGNLTVFVKERSRISKIIKCESLSYYTNKNGEFFLENCLVSDIEGAYRQGSSPINQIFLKYKSISKAEAISFFFKNKHEDMILNELPDFIEKYTYSTPYIWDYLFNKSCPGGGLELFERILYFFAFIIYGFLGLQLGIKMQGRINILIRGVVLVIYAILIPSLGLYIKLLLREEAGIFGLTYTFPLIIGIATFIWFKYGGKYGEADSRKSIKIF